MLQSMLSKLYSKMDKITIVKIGGKIINEDNLLKEFLTQFSKIEGMKVLVHGGGKSATDMLIKLGIEPKILDGRRVTDEATLEVCIGQYAGNINKKIVALLQSINTNAIGLSGADGGIIRSTKRPKEPIDYGYAGDIESIDTVKIESLIKLGFIPVFCALTFDISGQLLNTNADTIASSIATAMVGKAPIDLRYCFEFDGILVNLDSATVIHEIECDNFQKMINKGILKGGVIPKVHNAISAKQCGVNSVVICGVSNLLNLKNSTKIK